jgi:hypothetical protein
MAIPNGAGGYQVGDGNIGEAVLGTQGAPTAYAGATGTFAAADLAAGVVSVDSGGTSAGTYSLAAAADVDSLVSSAKVDSAFDFYIINTGDNAANDVTISGTGWTVVGSAVIADGTSAHYRARKTGVAAWTCYRLS